jgi:hypothetical protein
MFDIAINGMAVVGGDTFTFSQVDYSHFVPFNKAEYFHPYCQMDYSNATSDDVVRHPPSTFTRFLGSSWVDDSVGSGINMFPLPISTRMSRSYTIGFSNGFHKSSKTTQVQHNSID